MQQPAKFYRWLVSLILLLILIVPLSIYLLSPIIAHKSLEHWLLQQGFSDITFDIQHPRWNSLIIEKLELSKSTSDEKLYLASENIQINFNPVTLYLQQQIELIELPSLQLSIVHLNEAVSKTDTNPSIELNQLLPQQWFKKVPTDQLYIREFTLLLDYPNQIPDWRFNGFLSFDQEQFHAQIEAQRKSKALGSVDVTLNRLNQIALSANYNESQIINFQGTLTPSSESIELESQQEINIAKLKAWYENFELDPSSTMKTIIPEITGSITSQGTTEFPLKVDLHTLISRIKTTQQFTSTLRIAAPLSEIGIAELKAEGDVDFKALALSLSFSPKSQLTLHNLKPERHSKPIKRVDISLKKATNLDLNIANFLVTQQLNPRIKKLELAINSSEITLPKLQIKPFKLGVELTNIDLETMALNGQLGANSLNLTFDKQKLPLLTLKNRFTLKNQQLKNQFVLHNQNLPLEIKGSTSTNLTSHHTHFNWKTKPIKLSTIEQQMGDYLAIPPQLSLLSGTLFHNAQGDIKNNKVSLQTNNSIRQGSISWEETLVEEIEWDSRTRIYSSGKVIDTGKIKLGKVKTGINITNIESAYTYTQQPRKSLVKLKTLQAELLGGTVKAKEIQFDPFNPEVKTRIDIEKLDLAAVLELEQQKGLSGEGRLSGNLPLHYKDGELTISDGELKSLTPGGKIVFIPTPSIAAYAATNIGLKTAIDVLGNFHFTQLDIKLNYLADGTALLKTRLEGNNPDWNKGHPIDFTINIEENVLQLLKTLQFTDKLTKTVEKRYR